MRGGTFPRVAEETKVRLLREAVKLVGIDEVAQRLRTPANVVELWTRGLATMPDRKVLPLADLLDQFGRPEK